MKKGKYSLSKLSFLNTIVMTIVVTITFASIAVYESWSYYNYRLAMIEKSYLDKNKSLIKQEITNFSVKIQRTIQNKYKFFKDITNDRLLTIINTHKTILAHDPNLTYEEKEKFLFDIIDNFVYERGVKSTLYAFDKKGNFIFHSLNKDVVGKNIFEIFANNHSVINTVNKAIKEGKAEKEIEIPTKFLPQNSLGNKRYAMIKRVNENLYIGSSVILSDVHNQIKMSLFEELKTLRFGHKKYGYFWITNNADKMIFHPIRPELIGRTLTNVKSQNSIYVFKEINSLLKNKNEGYITYDWLIPGTNINAEKITFVKDLGIWGWRIGAGFYLYDLKENIEKEENQLVSLLLTLIFKTALVVSVLSVIIIFIAWLISKKFKKVEDSQKKYLSLLEQYKNILDKVAVISITDTEGKIKKVNSFFEQISGYSEDKLIGNTHSVMKDSSTPRETFKDMWDTIAQGKIWQGIVKNFHKDGNKSYFLQQTISPLLDENEEVSEYISVGIDITEVIEQKDKIQKIFHTDNLTKLGSRIKLLSLLEDLDHYSIALVDINRFMQINDVYGNSVGDEILKEVADEIFDFLNSYNMEVYRMYTDVFAVYSKTHDCKKFKKIVSELLKNISHKHYNKNSADIELHFTVGIACGNEDTIAQADIALKNAKQNKKNLVVYDKDDPLLKELADEFDWIKKLDKAISEERIVPFFQPIYNYDKEKITKYEVLMRYIEEDGTEVSPFKFLEIAKKTRLYPMLTKAVVEQAFDYFKNHRNLEFSINLTLEDLLNKSTMQYIFVLLKKYNLYKNLVIEIVESEELVGFDDVKNVLARFKEKGVKIAIDDFGSGYSNYAYILELEVDYIKIDGSIIKKVNDSQSTKDLIKSIVEFSQKSGIKTIGEFVSDETVDKNIRDLQLDYAQGYFYGKPLNKIV